MAEQARAEEVDVGRESEDHGLGQGPVESSAEPWRGLGPMPRPCSSWGRRSCRRDSRDERTVHPDALALGFAQEMHVATTGDEAAGRVLGVDPCLDGVAVLTSSCVEVKGSPAATRICCSTRSRPVTSSVTGCSTWSRVFISMKKKSSGSIGGDDELDRPDALVVDRPGDLDRGLAHGGSVRAPSAGPRASPQ